jgi:flagellar protein FliO/FliZ
MLCVSTALAAEDSERTPLKLDDGEGAAAAGSSGGGGSIVRTIVGLAIVIGVIYGVYWILKQVKASREESASGAGLSSVATLPLGTNRSLHLVRSGQELVLLGVGEQGVVPIRHYSEDEARDAGLIEDRLDPVLVAQQEQPIPLAELESAAPRKALPAAPSNGKPATPAEFLNRLLNEMRMRTVRR